METREDMTITWKIKNSTSLQSESIYSDQFVVGGCKWRLLAYPKGNLKANNSFSLFLNVPDKESLPTGWRRHVKFSLTVVNHFSEILSQLKEAQHWFDQKSFSSWGFSDMIALTELNANKGFLVNGELKIVAKVASWVLRDVEESVKSLFERHLDFASKVRPKNPCLKTAYMNVLLSLTQTLCKLPQELSSDDISDADAALAYLREAGFKLDWLEEKLRDVKEKKKKEEACLARLREMDEELQSSKKKCLDLEDQINKEKEELLVVRASLSLYNDNVV